MCGRRPKDRDYCGQTKRKICIQHRLYLFKNRVSGQQPDVVRLCNLNIVALRLRVAESDSLLSAAVVPLSLCCCHMQVPPAFRKEFNLAVLRRIDPMIENIVEEGGHTSVYHLSRGKWVCLNILLRFLNARTITM